MIKVTQEITQLTTTLFKSGDLVQSNKVFEGKRNIYILHHDVKPNQGNVVATRLVGNGHAVAPEYLDSLAVEHIEEFKGMLEIRNV